MHMDPKPESDQVYSTGQVATFCHVDPRTVLRWIKRGQLQAFQLPGRGDHRVSHRDLVAFMDLHQIPIPAELGPSKKRILVVDDDQAMAKAICRVVRSMGMETAMAFNGFHAGSMIERWRPDCITLDLSMPGMGGTQVLGMLRADPNYQHVRVLVISGVAADELEQARKLGADGVLGKPFENGQLIESLQLAMGADGVAA